MDEQDEFFAFSELSEGEFEQPKSCRGNACGALALRGNRRPNSNALRSISVNNSDSRAVRFSIDLGDALGGCGVTVSDTVFGGETFEVMIQSQIVLGYCQYRANFANAEELSELNERSNASCEFGGQLYSHESTICINDLDHKCFDGRWRRLGTSDSCP